MSIAGRLKLAAALAVSGVALVCAVLFSTTAQTTRELGRNADAGSVLQAVGALRELALEYGLRHDARARAQWALRSASLARLLAAGAAFAGAGAADATALAALQHGLVDADALFGQLVGNHDQLQREPGKGELLGELDARLSAQIANRMQAMATDAREISERSRRGVAAAQRRASGAVLLSAALLVLAVGLSILIARRSILGPLERLRKGTAMVGAGQLDFALDVRTDDELGQLARAFDGMTEQLRRTTVSRDALAAANAALHAEVAERELAEQKAYAQLQRLNLLHQITRSVGERQDLRSIFQIVVRCLEDQLPVDFACVFLYQPAQHALVVSSVGRRSAALAGALAMGEDAAIPIDANGLSRCVRGELVYEDDIAGLDFPFPRRLAGGGLRALVMAPLLAESTVFGVLVAARAAPHSFASGECEFLRQLSEHVALAANQAQLYGALQSAYDEIRQTQQAVMQQERLRALGQMASGIAHDINNAISPVALYTESLLETEPALSVRARDSLEVIKCAIDDVAATVARMREFYRQREGQSALAPVDANQLLQQVADLTRARWSDMPLQRGVVITLASEPAPGLPPIAGIDSEIREALTNLVFNAVDAMPDGGTLTLRTRLAVPAEGPPQVLIEVGDSGVGMDEETRRRCLEPFFTTKGERGTGLGLAMVYGMVERHGARIEIDTAPAQGSTMRLVFPLRDALVPVAPVTPQGAPPAGLRILVVDDDPLVLRAVRDILEIDGHQVVTADGGQLGIDTFTAAREAFALVITDLGMPYVDGRKVAAAIKRLAPATPVIMLTGWGQRLAHDGDSPPGVDIVLSKPPKLKALRDALAQVMAQGA